MKWIFSSLSSQPKSYPTQATASPRGLVNHLPCFFSFLLSSRRHVCFTSSLASLFSTFPSLFISFISLPSFAPLFFPSLYLPSPLLFPRSIYPPLFLLLFLPLLFYRSIDLPRLLPLLQHYPASPPSSPCTSSVLNPPSQSSLAFLTELSKTSPFPFRRQNNMRKVTEASNS